MLAVQCTANINQLNGSESLLYCHYIFFNVTFTCQNYMPMFGVSFVHIARLKCNVPFMSIYGSTWPVKLNLAAEMQFYDSWGNSMAVQGKLFESAEAIWKQSQVQFLSQPMPSKSITLSHKKYFFICDSIS